jgi:hypothetical protein
MNLSLSPQWAVTKLKVKTFQIFCLSLFLFKIEFVQKMYIARLQAAARKVGFICFYTIDIIECLKSFGTL